jgi:hypothetical protein
MGELWQRHPRRWASGILAPIALALAACAGIEPAASEQTGTVIGIYTAPAPGLFIDVALLDEAVHGPRWVRVNLHRATAAEHGLATARLAPGIAVAAGDTVRLRLQPGRELDTGLSGNRVIGVVGTDVRTIAALTDRR